MMTRFKKVFGYFRSVTDYIRESTLAGIAYLFLSTPYALATRGIEYATSTREPNPFYFALGVTLLVDVTRFAAEGKSFRHFRDNPGVFTGSALAYTAISKLIF